MTHTIKSLGLLAQVHGDPLLDDFDKSKHVMQVRSDLDPSAVTKKTHEKTFVVRKLSVILVHCAASRRRQHTWKNKKESVSLNSRRKTDVFRLDPTVPHLRSKKLVCQQMLYHQFKKWLNLLPRPTAQASMLRTRRGFLPRVLQP